MNNVDLEVNKENGAGIFVKTVDKDVGAESPPAVPAAMDASTEALKTDQHEEYSIGETIDDIVNELKNSGVTVGLDVDTCATCSDDVSPAGVSKDNGARDADHINREGTDDEQALSDGANASQSASEDKNVTREERAPAPLIEEPPSPPALQTAAAASELGKKGSSNETEEQISTINETNSSVVKGADEQDEEQQQLACTPMHTVKRNPSARSAPKRRSRILKVAVSGKLTKKPAGPKSSKKPTAVSSSQEGKQLVDNKEECSGENKSSAQLLKPARPTNGVSHEKAGETDVPESQGSLEDVGNNGTKRTQRIESSVTGEEEAESIDSEDEPVIRATKRGRIVSAGDDTEETGKDDVQHRQTPKRKKGKQAASRKKALAKKAKNAGKAKSRSQSSVKSEHGSSTSEVSDWNLQNFIESDAYVRDVIGLSLGSTNGRFLTIELPDEDIIKRRRVWRAPCARRSRPVVFGGCDPNQVYIDAMGVKVPISCWARVDHITPRVVVTDVFQEIVHRQTHSLE